MVLKWIVNCRPLSPVLLLLSSNQYLKKYLLANK